MADPVKSAALKRKIKKGRSVYNAAISEYLKILSLNKSKCGYFFAG
jgi:hypothetical protein